MEERENYTSLQEFTEDPAPGGNRPILEHSEGSQGIKRSVGCLRSQAAFLLIGFLASICANIVLTVLLMGSPNPGAHLDSSSLTLKMSSVQKRYLQLFKQCRECPEGWLHVGDQCYFFSNDKLDWLKSRDSCEEMGSHLTILHTIEQHDALEKQARKIGGFDYHFWIGLSDTEKEGDWRWVDNSTVEHTYWDQWNSEPDNHHSGGEHGEDCATLNSHSKTWFDVPCDFIYKRICQMAAIELN
ncbi:C-type lectin domain family 4 member E-like isoform X2 [Mastacembelus armatus]|uniref:C-type lectin domain family 4 member E-like isoform X2 n=1 Tax=Mastacembelus armatus TaxID=205130 RepID=UPI000E45C443|nr:C-type lectin domain family 4 member E-like isoform X2 [Mastacembelus armatus]